MYEIKQSTAETVPFFVHDSAGDAVTGLTDVSFTKRISKGSGSMGAMTVTISEDENGWYTIPLSTSHSDTAGLLTITFTNAGAKQVNLQWRVEARLVDDLNNFDATSDDVAVVTLVTTTTTNTDMRGTDSANTVVPPSVAQFDARTILAASYFDPTADAVANVTLVATTTTNTDMRGTDGANTTVPDAAGVAPTAVENRAEMDSNSTQLAKLGTPASDVSADIAAVKVDTAAILVDTGTTLPAQINSNSIVKNAALSNFEFLMVLASDGKTPGTGLTVTGQKSIDGAAFSSVSGTIAEVSNGYYQFDALAADTNGDLITWKFSAATAGDTGVTFLTI